MKYSNIDELTLITETAFESSLAGFWDWNILTNEEYLSPRFKEMFGYSDHEMENSPDSWQKIAFPEDLQEMFKSFEEHISSKGVTPFKSIVRYHHKNGNTIWVRCNGKVISWAEDGSPTRAIGCHVDITEEKEREFELKKALKEKNVLLGEVHHRVKNNLQLIQSLARLKQRDEKIEIHEIEDSINAIAKAHEAIYQTDRFDKIEIKPYIERITAPLISSLDINLNISSDRVHEKIDFLIQIGLIITECVNNSIKHGFKNDSERKLIEITIVKTDKHLKINYLDNGTGYPQDVINDVENLSSYGMILMQSISEQIDGTIEFSNSNGARTELTIPFQS